MSEELEFKHISVSSSDDDEVVIQAGAVDASSDNAQVSEDDIAVVSASAESEDAWESQSSNESDFAADDPTRGVGPSNELLEEAGLQAEDISEEARKEYEQHMRNSEARQEATRMVTTEEDLHTTMPFARMQRIIVVVLALLIVAAVAYWFVRHAG